MNRRKRAILNNAVRNVARILLQEIEAEIDEEIETKRLWVRKWISRRDALGASNGLLKELASEDPTEYFSSLRMSKHSFDLLLDKIKIKIHRRDTFLRSAVPAKTKLQTVLYWLATGCSLRT